jgi:hypothetical protein
MYIHKYVTCCLQTGQEATGRCLGIVVSQPLTGESVSYHWSVSQPLTGELEIYEHLSDRIVYHCIIFYNAGLGVLDCLTVYIVTHNNGFFVYMPR